jgi:hypothetical protein
LRDESCPDPSLVRGKVGTSAGVRPWRTLQHRPAPGAHPERHGEIILFSQWALPPNYACGLMDTVVESEEAPIGEVSFEVNPNANTEAAKIAHGTVRGDEDACWWIVDMCAQEVVRLRAGGFTDQLTTEQIVNQARPSSRLRARISWLRSGVGCAMVLDINSGFRLAIEGQDVVAEVLGPKGRMREVRAVGVADTKEDEGPAQYIGGGVILDTIVTCEIQKCISTSTDATETLTQTFCVPAGVANVRVPVPARARFLQVSMPAPGLLNPLAWVVQSNPGEIQLGQLGVIRNIPFDPFLTPRTTSVNPKPGNANYVLTGLADPDNDRVFTFVWTLEI